MSLSADEKRKEFLKKITRAFEELKVEEMSVSTMSSYCGFSPWHFQRLFHALTGQSIGTYLRSWKLSYAARELKDSEKSIIEIAMDCGFNSHEAFSRSFKNYFSESPSSFRNRRPEVVTLKAPKLRHDYLEHLQNIDSRPSFVQLPQRRLAGLEVEITSPLSQSRPDFKELVPVWHEFLSLAKGIPSSFRGEYIGLNKSETGTNEEERLCYMASCEVLDGGEIPEGLKSIELPPQRYAVFHNKGQCGATVYVTDYIYGGWLATAKESRGVGHDYISYPSGFKIGDPEAESRYFLPVSHEG